MKSEKGCPQGSPLSPMLSNIVLNELDQELEARGHRYARWADDFLVFVKTERAALRVRDSLYRYLESELHLPVNREKSKVLPSDKVVFLGFRILSKRIGISMEARHRFRKRVREMTKRNNPYSMYQVVTKLNGYLRGWLSYFSVQEFKRPLEELDMFIRSRLRSMQLKKWKKPGKFQRMLIRSGFPTQEARNTWVHMRKWKSTQRTHVKYLLNINWFRRLGLIRLADSNPTNLEFQLNR